MLDPGLARRFAARLSTAFDRSVEVRAAHPIEGGCISTAARLETSAGPVFAKWNANVAADLFEREADGLAELLAAGSSLAIPRVFAAESVGGDQPGFILMEHLEPADPGPGAEHALGHGLAELHRHRGPAFGFRVPSYCGATRQSNSTHSDWVDFYREARLRPLLDMLDARQTLAGSARGTYERVMTHLPELLAGPHEPSLVHGDLWSGNVLHCQRGPALVDPACAYACREFEFGIATLFGGLSRRAFDAYDEAWPLPPGWRERNPLYQLYHLLNHQLLFGGGYGAQALAVARRFV